MSAHEGSAWQEQIEAAKMNPQGAPPPKPWVKFTFEVTQRCSWREPGPTLQSQGHWPIKIEVEAVSYEAAHQRVCRAFQKLVDEAR